MFTGLIQDIGEIQSLERKGGGLALTIATRLDRVGLRIGDSIAVEGVCLTVVRLSGRTFSVEVSPETLQRSTLQEARPGQPVNLETSLKLSDLLGGHLVSGHVDGTGKILEILPEGNAQRYRFGVPPQISRYLIEKGSVAVDGISLTVAGLGEKDFTVSVIPHTAQTTTLGKKKVGDRVNLENDLIAKYVEKFLHRGEAPPRQGSRIDEAFLARHGFLK